MAKVQGPFLDNLKPTGFNKVASTFATRRQPITPIFTGDHVPTSWRDIEPTKWDSSTTAWDSALTEWTYVIHTRWDESTTQWTPAQPLPQPPTRTKRYVRQPPRNATSGTNDLTPFRDRNAIAYQSWQGLKTWKQSRWTTTAKQYGVTGWQLYLTEYVRQKITPGHLPINPGSRRVLVPSSSSFDFTP
jgi:hypothetical protein